MYIRTKKRETKKGQKEYAYEAKSIRTKKGPRQKIVSYLGKVHSFDDTSLTLPFYLSTDDIEEYFSNKSLKTAVNELLIFELVRHGFVLKENSLTKKDYVVNLDDKTVKYCGKEAVLRLNQGYLCSKTLKKCFSDINSKFSTKELIKSFLLIGLNPDEDSFMTIFRHKI